MRKRVATLVAAAALLAGCGDGVEGSPVAAERWDPCSLTSEAIEAAGLDSSSRFEGWGSGIEVSEWGRCVFDAPGGADSPYGLSVMSSAEHSVAEARADTTNRAVRDFEVEGRDAFMYVTEFGEAIRDCRVAIDVPPGVVIFTVLYETADGVDACEVVMKHVDDLQSALPATEK